MIVVVDFGSQTAHLISRRIAEFGIETHLVTPQKAIQFIKNKRPNGIILSGGPASVYEKNAPEIDKEIFSLGIPILGICYGLQLASKLLGGKVIPGRKEYGPATLLIANSKLPIANKLSKQFIVWMSHGDEIVELPKGFSVVGTTQNMPFAFVENKKEGIYGVQFHPEVEHTEQGIQILKNFVNICNLEIATKIIDVKKIEQKIKEQVGEAYVIGAISGGVDSTVAGIITAKAIGDHFLPIYIENGLMREGTAEHVKKIFTRYGKVKPIIVEARGEMLQRLHRISDPERKRKVIGNFYIELFEREMQKLVKSGFNVQFLLQGTIYSDVIESKGSKHAAKIKSHHNVGGLPKYMKLKLLEPMREFYKDEVRKIGKELGIPDEFVWKQPFPGPGYAIRIRGEVTPKRLEMERIADVIVLEELKSADLLDSIFLSFPVLTNAYSTAVKGDGRLFGEVICLRVVQSKDVMTSTWAHLPYEVLQKISSRIVNEVPDVSRVVYDITTKPPATMEWE